VGDKDIKCPARHATYLYRVDVVFSLSHHIFHIGLCPKLTIIVRVSRQSQLTTSQCTLIYVWSALEVSYPSFPLKPPIIYSSRYTLGRNIFQWFSIQISWNTRHVERGNHVAISYPAKDLILSRVSPSSAPAAERSWSSNSSRFSNS
jgi:hypothetical protein